MGVGLAIAESWAKGAGGSAFDPKVVPGLVLDLNAAIGVTLDGSNNVQTWSDQSGVGDASHNATQATAGLRPSFQSSSASYGGAPTVTISGSQLLLTGTWAAPLTPPFTVVIAGHTTSNASNNAFLAGTVALTIQDLDGTQQTVSESLSLIALSGTLNTACISYYIIDGASSSIGRNALTPVKTGTTGGPQTDSRFAIGNFSGGGTNALNGPIARMLVYTGHLTSPQLTAVMQGMGSTYGITIGP